MEITGQYRIAAPRASVWAALGDPDLLREAIPGCEALERVSATAYRGRVRVQFGPAAIPFEGTLRLQSFEPPEKCSIVGESAEPGGGSAHGTADLRLRGAGEDTELDYAISAEFRGRVADLATPVTETAARVLVDDFLRAFAAALAARRPQPADPWAGTDEYLNPPAGVPPQHTAPGEAPIEDRPAEAEAFAEEAEQELEVAAARGTLGGPYVWGLLALLVVIVLILIFSR